jgi:FkbM family methyltransferase
MVFAFEANPAMEQTIRRTYRLNGVTPRLDIALVGRTREESVPFYVGRHFWAGSSFSATGLVRTRYVRQESLEAILESVKPSLVILDVEGGELDLLPILLSPSGASVRKIIVEVHPSVLGDRVTSELEKSLLSATFALKKLGETWAGRREIGSSGAS